MIYNIRKGLIKISREKSGKIGVRVTYQVRIYPRNGRISEPYSEINEIAKMTLRLNASDLGFRRYNGE